MLFLGMDFGWNWLKNMLTYNYIIIIIIIIIIITAIYVDTNFVIFVQWIDIWFDSNQCLNFGVFS
jgi:hypothetical protein